MLQTVIGKPDTANDVISRDVTRHWGMIIDELLLIEVLPYEGVLPSTHQRSAVIPALYDAPNGSYNPPSDNTIITKVMTMLEMMYRCLYIIEYKPAGVGAFYLEITTTDHRPLAHVNIRGISAGSIW